MKNTELAIAVLNENKNPSANLYKHNQFLLNGTECDLTIEIAFTNVQIRDIPATELQPPESMVKYHIHIENVTLHLEDKDVNLTDNEIVRNAIIEKLDITY